MSLLINELDIARVFFYVVFLLKTLKDSLTHIVTSSCFVLEYCEISVSV